MARKISLPAVNEIKHKVCTYCKVQKEEIDFFHRGTRDARRLTMCKQCVDKRINYEDIETIYIMLKTLNIPFIKKEWDKLLENSEDKKIFGFYVKYIQDSPMFHGYGWKNSVFAEEVNAEEQKIYSVEWCGDFTPRDLKYLNDYYNDLDKNFKIVTRSHVDYARKIAKASLAMDKAYMEMLEGNSSEHRYKNLQSIFDTLSKSAQFTESERGLNNVSLGNFGTTFDLVEKKRWIPEHKPNKKDMYDKLIDQLSNLEKSL